jgi:hypothetical protein
MVDALKESWRVLHNDGVLLDFRPLVDAPPIEIVSRESTQGSGSVDDRAAAGDSAAADAAIRTVVESGVFRPLTNTRFETAYYWDSVEEMSEYLASRRHRMSMLPSQTHVTEVFDKTAGESAPARLRCRWRNQLNSYTRRP